MRALLGEHSFHDRVSKFFRTKATLALSKKPQRVARGETVEKVRFGGNKMGTLFRDLRRQFVSSTWMSGVFYLQTIFIQVSFLKYLDFFQHGNYNRNQR